MRLHYRGEAAFKTIFGGLITIFLLLVVCAGFVFFLVDAWINPKFTSFVPSHSYYNLYDIAYNVSTVETSMYAKLEAYVGG